MGDPQRIPLAIQPSNRDESTARDAKIINAYLEIAGQDDLRVYKRPGYSSYSSVTAGTGMGATNWNGDIYTIVAGTLYKNGASVGTGMDTTGGVYCFGYTLGGTHKVVMHNGVIAYTYDPTNGLVQITSSNFPTSLVKGVQYLDTYTCVMNTSAAIYNSNADDPQTWAGDFLTAIIEPDQGVFLGKNLVYLLAFKQWTIETFNDAGNATGSPLGPVQGGQMNIGCRHADSVRELEGMTFWVSQTRGAGLAVHMATDLRPQKISTPSIERLIQDADFTTVYSWTGRVAGHSFYCVTLVNSNLSLVYDLTSKAWYQWTDANGNYLPFVSSTFSSTQQLLLQHATNGAMYWMDITFPTDNGSTIVMDIYTPNYDGGVRTRKYVNSMDFIADQTNGSKLKVRHSDDDYQSWTNFREVDLSKKRPRLTDCGTFRRRAWHLRHDSNTALRMQAVELNIDLGTL